MLGPILRIIRGILPADTRPRGPCLRLEVHRLGIRAIHRGLGLELLPLGMDIRGIQDTILHRNSIRLSIIHPHSSILLSIRTTLNLRSIPIKVLVHQAHRTLARTRSILGILLLAHSILNSKDTKKKKMKSIPMARKIPQEAHQPPIHYCKATIHIATGWKFVLSFKMSRSARRRFITTSALLPFPQQCRGLRLRSISSIF
mmetsp:Transcript_26210/g.56269  ORF Transcript_26210/g.56269 Transcript_26210/m.56269 type:complete len:201 (+) Transcript_26210:1798-2400(+)